MGQDRKQLLVCCLVGIAVGVMLVAAGLALRHLLGRARLPNRRRTPWPGHRSMATAKPSHQPVA